MTNTTTQPLHPSLSLTGKEACKDEQAFSAWAEAVKYQMLEALQKRQRIN